MKQTDIILKWKKKGKEYLKEVDREKFLNLMRSVKNAFVYDNEYAGFFCKIIPEVDMITINKDRNEEVKVPFFEYELDERTYTVEIYERYKIIWAILDEYTR